MIRHFYKFLNKKINQITIEDVRRYLEFYRTTKAIKSYANLLCSLKRYFRDYLHKDYLVESFEFPNIEYIPPIAPSDNDLRTFYNALPTMRYKALFLLLAASGRRLHEVLELTKSDINWEMRMILPKNTNKIKRTWYSFFNEETETILREYLQTRKDNDTRLFTTGTNHVGQEFKKVADMIGIRITPQTLRVWFACKMGDLNVPDRYIDAFCGRTPKSVLARHYTDYSPERLKRIYDKANLKILS